MSAPNTLALRPAIDTRPPAQPWAGPPPWSRLVPPDQPTLQLVLAPDVEQQLAAAPVPTKVPVTVDVVPAGAADREPELLEQARVWAPWFAQLLTEALEGRRPLESLNRWLDEWVLAEVGRRVRLLRRSRSSGRPVPTASVVSLRTQFTHPRVLEVAVHMRRAARSGAWAFQLVQVGDRWRCTALVVDPLPDPVRRAASSRTAIR